MEPIASSGTALKPHPESRRATSTASFLAMVLDGIDDIEHLTRLDVRDPEAPRLVTTSPSLRTYSLTLPGRCGPYEIWANAEMSVDDPLDRWLTLHDREEVLAQAMHTTRLAWHRAGTSGWIGLPVALAARTSELDCDLATDVAEQFALFVSTVERVSRALDDRTAGRSRRRRRGRPDVIGPRVRQGQVSASPARPGQ